jgi:hypothetical protein
VELDKYSWPLQAKLVRLRDILDMAPHSCKFLVVNTSCFVHIIVCSPMQRNTFVTGHI